MDEQTGSIKVHLVHGTWANGFLKPKQAWFDPGSEVYERLRDHLPANTDIESFKWSGRNTITSRATAAESFCVYLQDSIAQHPDSDHIIVAHSHGGTVVADALSRLSERSQELARVKGLVCLATPFVYLGKPSLSQLRAGCVFAIVLLLALLWSGLLTIFPNMLNSLSGFGLVALVVFPEMVSVSIVLVAARARYDSLEPHPPPKMPTEVPVFLLRATRDEASLSLGLAQAFSVLSYFFARHFDLALRGHFDPALRGSPLGTVMKPVTFVAYVIVGPSCLALGALLTVFFQNQLGTHWPGMVLLVINLGIYAPAIAGAAYFAGYALLAMATGHTKIIAWLTTTVEVDAAPPEVFCQLKIYTTPDTSSNSLRHGLYEHEDVIRDVGAIVSKLSSKI